MAQIPSFFIDSVIAIGKQVNNGASVTTHWIGTGFIFGRHLSTDADNANKRQYKTYLVTNKHVITGQLDLVLRFNPQIDQPAIDFPITLEDKAGRLLWTGHPDPNVDVAVLGINSQLLETTGMKFSYFKSDTDILSKQGLIDNQISEGDFIYVLGFPLGLMPTDRQHVVVRSGIIARIRDLYENRSSSFTVDSSVFPGNSGGPVVNKPEISSIRGTTAFSKAALIGIVKSYIPFQDVAISQQTQRARIIFEENSGLAIVETVDKIIESIDAHDLKSNVV